MNDVIHRLAGLAAAAMATLLFAQTADAIQACKAKVNKKNGNIELRAKGVTGTALWGPSPASVSRSLVDPGTCIRGDKLVKCLLGASESIDAIAPPDECRIHLADDGMNTCSAYVKGCTPRKREVFSVMWSGFNNIILEETGDWVDSIVYTDPGEFDVTFAAGVFADAPVCILTGSRTSVPSTELNIKTQLASPSATAAKVLVYQGGSATLASCQSAMSPCVLRLVCLRPY